MADRQPGLFLLRVIFIVAFFIQVVFSDKIEITTNSIKISVNNINESSITVISAKDGSKVYHNVTVTNTSLQIQFLHPGMLYNITAATKDGINKTWELSTFPEPVSNVTVEVIERTITVTWIKHETFSYIVCLTDIDHCDKTGNKNMSTFNKLKYGKRYNVSIIVHANGKNSSVYETFKVLPPLPPTEVNIMNFTTSSVIIKWSFNSNLSDGSKWHIEYNTSTGSYQNTSEMKNITLESLQDGMKYEVKIWTISNSVHSQSSLNKTFITIPKPVSNVTVEYFERTITVTWIKRELFNYTVCLTNINRCIEMEHKNMSIFNNLTPGRLYNVSIIVHAYEKNSSIYETFKVLAPLPPTEMNIMNFTTSSVIIKWSFNSSLSDGSKWHIQYNTSTRSYQNTSEMKNITLESLQDGMKYEVKIWTISNSVRSQSSLNKTFVTIPKPVSNVTVEVIERNITVTWIKRELFNYTVCLTNIDRCIETEHKNMSIFNNLTPGRLYNVSIIVHAYEKNSSIYETFKVLAPLPPTEMNIMNFTTSSVIIKWSFNSSLSDGSKWHIQYNTSTRSYQNTSEMKNITLESLQDGMKYEVKIWTISNSVRGQSSLNKTFVTIPKPVSNVTVEVIERNITVTWIKRELFNYTVCLTNIDRCIETENKNMSIFNNLKPGKLYNVSIIVHAYEKNSSIYETFKVLAPLPPTEMNIMNFTTSSVIIKWSFNSSLSDGSKWYIEYNTSTGSYQNTSEMKNITLESLQDGMKYEVKIWTISNSVRSQSSLNKTFVTIPKPVSNVTVEVIERTITVTWIKRELFNYTVCLTNINRCDKKENKNMSIFNNLKPGKLYNVSIIVHAYEKNSSIYETFKVLAPLPPTEMNIMNFTTSSVIIKWSFNSSLSDGSKWHIQYTTSTGSYQNTSEMKNITLESLQDGMKYEVKIWTISNSVRSQSSLNTTFVTIPKPVSNVTVEVIERNITVTWIKREIFNYTVCLTNIHHCIETENKNMSIFNNLKPGKLYNVSIIVHAYKKNSSIYETFKVLAPLPPTEVNIMNFTTSSVIIKWSFNSSLSDGSKWHIQYTTSTGSYQNTSEMKNITLESLQDGMKYEVKIWTISNSVRSQSSLNETFVTIPEPVSNVTVECFERTITVTWIKREIFNYTVCLTNIDHCIEMKNENMSTFSNLTAGILYNVSIIVHAYDKNSSVYETSKVLPPLPPSNVTKNIIDGVFFMEWYFDANISAGSEWFIQYKMDIEDKYTNASTNVTSITLNLKDGVTYEMKIWTISLGVTSISYLNFSVFTAPEEVLIKRHTEINSQLSLYWSPPALSNITKYQINYSENCLREMVKKFEKYLNPILQYTFPIKPGCDYNITIWAFTSIKGKPGNYFVRTKSFEPPVENRTNFIKIANVKSKSLTVTLESNPFNETNGPIVDYNIIVATNTDKKYTNKSQLATWKEFKKNKNIKAYQIFKNCSKLYEKSNACNNLNSKLKRSLNNIIEHDIGILNCENVNGYCNGYLDPDTDYYIKIRAFTYDMYADTAYSSAIKIVSAGESMPGYLIAIICIIVILIIVIIGGIIFMKRRQNTKHKPVNPAESPYLMQPTSHPVRSADFETHFAHMSADSDCRFAEEYESLKEVGKHNKSLTAHFTSNRIKNRFVNILPYDFSRVKLSNIDDEEGSDYINANYIPGFTSRREYIATQGPLSSTRDEFWRMIWEQNVHNIVMLANCIEKHREKCDHYWPPNDEARCYGNITVEKLNETITSDWTITEFLMSNKDHVARNLLHCHFTSWPDFGVPSSPQTIVMFAKIVRQRLLNIGPIVIHCSAGVGRSGTFISVDHSLQDLKHNNEVDVLRVVHEMRQYRSLMVQTEEQYIYIHHCILYAIHGDGENKDDIYENTFSPNDTYENVDLGHVNKAFLYGPFFHAGIFWKDLQIQKFAGVLGAGISRQDALPNANNSGIITYFPNR